MIRISARYIFSALALSLLASGCQTVQRDLTVERVSEDSFRTLEGWEIELVVLEAQSDRDALADLRARLAEAGERPVLERSYAARLSALSGRAALLAGDRSATERELKKALSLHPADEVARVLEARLERNQDKRLVLLEEALGKSDGQARLQAERGRVLLAGGRYADALAAFDASLPLLPEAYEKAFGAERRRALALRDASGSAAYVSDRPLTLQDMATLTQAESSLVDFITGGKTWASGVLFERLRSAGYYTDAAAAPSATVRRSEAAFFLWRLVANRKGDRALLTKYSERYALRAYPSSPVPDVPVDAQFFDAALGCVEREIMDLPDGRLFYPNDPVTGVEFYRWLKKAADL